MSYNLENFLEDFKRDLKPCPWYGYNCSIKKKFIKLLQERKEELWDITNFNVINTNPGSYTVDKYGIDKIDFARPIILSETYYGIIFLTDENQDKYDMRNEFFQDIGTLIVLGNISKLEKPMNLSGFRNMTDLQIILPNLKSTGSYICENSESLLQVEFCVPSLINLGDIFSYSFLNNCPGLTFCIFDAPKLVFSNDNVVYGIKKNLIYFRHNFKSTIADVNNCRVFNGFITLTKEKKDICEYFIEKYNVINNIQYLSAENKQIIENINANINKKKEEKKEEKKKAAPKGTYFDVNGKLIFGQIPLSELQTVGGKKSTKSKKKISTKKGMAVKKSTKKGGKKSKK